MRLPIIRFSLSLLGVLLLATPTEAQKGRGDRAKLTLVDIQEAGAGIVTARDAVRLLRPQWLTPRMGRVASSDMLGSGGGRQEVVVYIDDIRQPDLESLSTVLAAKIFELKYLDQNRAVQAHGTGHEAGVIHVTTVDKRK
ncbi:MAG: hypothetical protein Q8K82_12440 [Gemmatimonadaceae bacterium]|nr:hypothetical protein [Gemmatimonadaceae bacterium]